MEGDLAPQTGGKGPSPGTGNSGGRRRTHRPCSASPPGSAPTGSASCPGLSQVPCTRLERGPRPVAPGPQSRTRPAEPLLPPMRRPHGSPPPPPWPCFPPPSCEWRPGAEALPRLSSAGGRLPASEHVAARPTLRPPRGRGLGGAGPRRRRGSCGWAGPGPAGAGPGRQGRGGKGPEAR